MNASLMLAIGLALIASMTGCAGHDRSPVTGRVGIELGGSGYVRLERHPDGSAVATVLEAPPSGETYVRFEFSEHPNFRMLKTENGYPFVLRFDAQMCISERGVCAETNVIPIAPNGGSFESWTDPIDQLIFSNFRLTPPD